MADKGSTLGECFVFAVKVFLMPVSDTFLTLRQQQGFRKGGGGGFRTPPLSTTGGGGYPPPCWQKKLKYFLYFTVISVKIDHFKHQHLKFLLGVCPHLQPTLVKHC